MLQLLYLTFVYHYRVYKPFFSVCVILFKIPNNPLCMYCCPHIWLRKLKLRETKLLLNVQLLKPLGYYLAYYPFEEEEHRAFERGVEFL